MSQLNYGRKVGQERRVDREEGELEALRSNIGRISKHKLYRAFDGGVWLTVFPSLQDGMDLSRDKFRVDLR